MNIWNLEVNRNKNKWWRMQMNCYEYLRSVQAELKWIAHRIYTECDIFVLPMSSYINHQSVSPLPSLPPLIPSPIPFEKSFYFSTFSLVCVAVVERYCALELAFTLVILLLLSTFFFSFSLSLSYSFSLSYWICAGYPMVIITVLSRLSVFFSQQYFSIFFCSLEGQKRLKQCNYRCMNIFRAKCMLIILHKHRHRHNDSEH